MTRVVFPAATREPLVSMASPDSEPIIDTLQCSKKSDYKIEDNIPPPPRRVGASKYPFPDMKPGQSFFIPNGKLKTILASSQSYRNSQKQKGNIVSFASRPWVQESKDGGREVRTPGVRCWRIK